MANGFDCATKLNGSTAAALKANGFDYVARYLGNNWKSFDASEVAAIHAAGLKLISIYESAPTHVGYFTKGQGMSDAQSAYKYAKAVGQPAGSAIYFTVDYDAQPGDMGAIVEYLSGIKQLLTDYKIGIYGSYAVMQAARGHVDYYWQTYAWSRGQVADFTHIYQHENGVTVAGVQLDKDEIKQEPGAWGGGNTVAQANVVHEIKYIYTGGYAGPALLKIHDYLFNRGHGFDCKRGPDGSIIFLVGPFDTSQPNWVDAYDNIIKIDPGMHLYNPGQAANFRK